MNEITNAMAARIRIECEKRNLSQDDLFVSLETNHGWRPIDCIRWIKYGQLSLLKVRDLAEAIGCSMDDLLPLPEGANRITFTRKIE